jgi:hypothetical protein
VRTDVFLGFLPKEITADCVTVYEYKGLPSIHASSNLPGKALAEQPRIQVVARSESYKLARKKANDCMLVLDGLSETTINGTRYLYIHALEPPFPMRDKSDRFLLGCNYQVVKELSLT